MAQYQEEGSTIQKSEGRKFEFYINLLIMSALFIGYLLTTGLELVESSFIKQILRISALALAILIIAQSNRVMASSIIAIISLIILFLLNLNPLIFNLIYLIILIESLKRLSTRQAAIVFFVASALVVFIHIFLLGIGRLDTTSVQVGQRSRSALGFSNANQFALVYLSLIFSTIFLYYQMRSKYSYFLIALVLTVALPMIQISGSRTSMFSIYSLLILLLSWLMLSRIKLLNRYFVLLTIFVPFIAVLITLVISTSNSMELNVILSLRPYFFKLFLANLNIVDFIFGWRPVFETGVDNGYLVLFSCVGFGGSLVVMTFISMRIYAIPEELLPLVIVLLVASIFESFLLRPEIPLAVMFLFIILRSHNSNCEGKQYA